MNRFAASAVTDANSKQKLYLESFKVSEKSLYAASLFVSRNILFKGSCSIAGDGASNERKRTRFCSGAYSSDN